MDKLSVAIITKNEEKNIARCLDSVKGLADEIVVVDSFSTDSTRDLCLERGAKFSEHPFAGHIEQKNHAFSLCKFNHILSLDADEALSDELYASVLKAKERGFGDGYSMNRRTRYCGKWIRFGGWYPDRKIRLVRKDAFAWAGQNPHDELMSRAPVKVAHLKGDLLHYSINSLDDHRRVVENFSTIAAKAMFQKNLRPGPIKKYASAVFKFLQSYIVRLGFLEGIHGWNIARLSAKSKYLKYKKLELMYKGDKASRNQ